MTTDPNAQPMDFPPPPAKSGSKVWLYLGLGCGLVLLLCCGGGIIGTVFVGKNAMQMTQVPAEVQQQSNQVANFDVPPGFKPDTAVTINVPFTGQKFMTMVSYTPPDKDGMIFLVGVGQIGAGADREQMKMQVEQQMNQQGQQKKKLDVLESRDVQVDIRGKPATFTIQKAEDPQTKRQYIQVEGVFEGKEGPAILIGQIKADEFSEDDAENLVQSIK